MNANTGEKIPEFEFKSVDTAEPKVFFWPEFVNIFTLGLG